MTRASHSPSNPERAELRFAAGPLAISVGGTAGPAMELIERTLSLYDVAWTLTPPRPVSVNLEMADAPTDAPARGDYLECAQMLVDTRPGGLRATTARGAALTGHFIDGSEEWHMTVPDGIVRGGWWPEIEDLVSLIVTTGWRRAGWVPLHAAGLTRDDLGVVVCATSRGGKTTFSLAMARRGWRMVGDDKLLLGRLEGRPVIAAVKHMLNVDPVTTSWFAEMGDLSRLPIYSEWSPKRRVALASVLPEAPELTMVATHVVALARGPVRTDLRIEPMNAADIIAALLHQSVIPTERGVAGRIMGELVALAQSARGLRVVVPDGAYAQDDVLAPLERAFG